MYAFLLDLAESRKREYLKSTGIRQNRAIPVHKLMQTTQLLHNLITGAYMQMIRIGQLHLRTDLMQINSRNSPLDGGCCTNIHKYGCLDRPMNGLKLPSFCSSVLF